MQFLVISLLFSHLDRFLTIYKLNTWFVFYIIIAASIIVFINEAKKVRKTIETTLDENDYLNWQINHSIFRYLIASAIFTLLLLFPNIYSNKVFFFLPDLYLKLIDYKIFSIITVLTGIGLFIYYCVTIVKIFRKKS